MASTIQGKVRARLEELGLKLYGPHPPHDPLEAVVLHGGIARTSGQLPRIDGAITCAGRLGETVTIESASAAAAVCALNALAVLEASLGSLDAIVRVLNVTGYVASAPGFNDQPLVVDGASRVLVEIFGPAGRHTRCAIGVAELPRGSAVEIELTVAVKPALCSPDPASRELERELLELGTATLIESGAIPMPARIRPVWAGASLAAPAFPVHCGEGDNLAIHVAVSKAPPGSALVVDVGDKRDLGFWGEVLTTAAIGRGLVGLVIDGGVRDTAALEARRFPVLAAMVALPGASKVMAGTAGLPTRVGGVEVRVGDWVVGDCDGAAIVQGGQIEQVIRGSRARAAAEAAMFEKLLGGATTVDLLGLDPSPIRS